MSEYEEILKLLFNKVLEISDEVESHNKIEYVGINWFYDSETLDIGLNIIFINEDGEYKKEYYSILTEEFESQIKLLLINSEPKCIYEIMKQLYKRYIDKVSTYMNYEIELEEMD